MFLIRSLHQTTTIRTWCFPPVSCSLYARYIKPQPLELRVYNPFSCSLYARYIKPQQWHKLLLMFVVVPYTLATSNHNQVTGNMNALIVVPYTLATSNHNPCGKCINCLKVVPYTLATSNHNICRSFSILFLVVPYTLATSNHNDLSSLNSSLSLFLIRSLHQTTTLCCVIS